MTLRTRTLAFAAACALLAACVPPSDSGEGDGDNGAAGDGASGGAGGGGAGAGGDAGSGGGSAGAGGGSAGAGGGSAGAGGGTVAGALPEGTLLYVRSETKDHDVLVARDLATNAEHVITDLTGDGSQGWEIDGYALSPDRTRIALASLYGPTAEDTATGLATRRIWNLAVDGTDFVRLTPVFPNTGGGKNTFQIDVGDPMWTADGSKVLYGYGEYWWEGTDLRGGSFPWVVAADGNSLPSFVTTVQTCSVLYPSRNPATGEMLYIHSVCIPGQGEDGLYLYPEGGSSNPTQLLGKNTSGLDLALTRPSWLADGSGFLFIAGTYGQNDTPDIAMYDMGNHTAKRIFSPPAGFWFDSLAISPDASKIVYCLRDGNFTTLDLHVIDLSTSPPSDTALTSDGKSCHPSF